VNAKYLPRINTVIVALLCLLPQAQASFVGTSLELQSPSPTDDDKYGRAVSIDGDVAVIQADEPNNCGSLYVYRLNGLDWQYETTLIAPNSVDGDFFGRPVSVVGDIIVAAAKKYDSSRGAV